MSAYIVDWKSEAHWTLGEVKSNILTVVREMPLTEDALASYQKLEGKGSTVKSAYEPSGPSGRS